MDSLDFPKMTVVATLGILKDAGGYQLKPEELAIINEEQLYVLNKLTPGQFYGLILIQKGSD